VASLPILLKLPDHRFAAPVKLRFYRFERLKADLPFELHDVPLP
jgi:hypothetical protein